MIVNKLQGWAILDTNMVIYEQDGLKEINVYKRKTRQENIGKK